MFSGIFMQFNPDTFIKTKKAVIEKLDAYLTRYSKEIPKELMCLYSGLKNCNSCQDFFLGLMSIEMNMYRYLNNKHLIRLEKEIPFKDQLHKISRKVKINIAFLAELNLAFIKNTTLDEIIKISREENQAIETIAALISVDKFVSSPNGGSKKEKIISKNYEDSFLMEIKKLLIFSLLKVELVKPEFIEIMAKELNFIYINGKYSAKARSVEVNPTSASAYAISTAHLDKSLHITDRLSNSIRNTGTDSSITIPVWPEADQDYVAIAEGREIYFDNEEKVLLSLFNHLCGSISFDETGHAFLSPYYIDIYHECLHARNNALGNNLANSDAISDYEKKTWSNVEEFAVITGMPGCQNEINKAFGLPNTRGHAGIPAIIILKPQYDEYFLTESINFYTINKNEELLTAVRNNDFEKITQLYDDGVNINAIDHNGNNALLIAIYQKNIEMVTYLLHLGASCIVINKNYYDALSLAVDQGSGEIVKLLLQNEVYINYNKLKTTPLIQAVKNNAGSIVRMLLQHPKLTLGVVDNEGKDALTHAIEGNLIEMVNLIITHCGFSNRFLNVNFWGPSHLQMAVKLNRVEMIELFYNNGFNINKAVKFSVDEKNFELAYYLYSLKLNVDESTRKALLIHTLENILNEASALQTSTRNTNIFWQQPHNELNNDAKHAKFLLAILRDNQYVERFDHIALQIFSESKKLIDISNDYEIDLQKIILINDGILAAQGTANMAIIYKST